MADWIKLSTTTFNNPKIKIIRSYPDGDSLCLLWIAMIALAGSINDDGAIRVTDSVAYTSKTLGLTLGFDEAVVKAGLEAFQELGMIEIDEAGVIYLTGWGKHQNVSGLERIKEVDKIKEKERLRKQKQRAKARQGQTGDCPSDVPEMSPGQTGDCPSDVPEMSPGQTGDCPSDVPEHNKNKNKSIDNYDDDNNPISLNSLQGETYSKAIKTKAINSTTVEVVPRESNNISSVKQDNNNTKAQDIFALYGNNISPITPILAEKVQSLIADYGEAAVKYGIEAAVEQGVRTYPYVLACAKNYLSDGGKTGKQQPRGKPKVNDVEGTIAQISKEIDEGKDDWW